MSTEKSTDAPSFSVQSSSSSIFTSTPTIRTSTPTIHTSTSTVITSTPSTNSDVYIYKGNLDTYVGNTGSMPTKPNQIYVANAPGLIMVPSMITAPNYLIVNSQTNPLSNVLTDTDIMKMPTVILDEGAQSKNTKQNAPQQSTSQKCKPLVPKSDGITISTKTGDYLATYNKDGVVVVSSEEDVVPKRRRPGLRKKLPRQAKMKKKETKPKEEKQKSPTTPINKTVSKKSTPRSGSHVRTLNFASPSKGRERRESDSFNKESKNDTNVVQDDVRPISAWDSDLRELLIPKPRIKPQSPDSSDDKLDLTCEDDEELEKGAKLIEDAFKTPVKKATDDENEPLDLPMKTEVETIVVCEKQEESQNAKKESPIEVVTVEQTEICLRNINVPPRFKKKCNISNNTVQHCEIEVVIERNEVADKQVSEIIKKREAQLKETRTTSTKTIVLETPSKALPKTPGKSELTPFSKALEEQLQGMDLLEIQTPNILATPSFPLTPGLGLISPMPVNRPTDYSTSSSYYQPSDTEQNKSLELMIEECKRLEKKRLKESETNTNIDEENIDSSNNKTVTNLSEVKRVFNENVIGKKNLNLLKHKSSSSSSSEDSSSSYSSSSDSSTSGSDSEYDPSQNNDTVVKNNYCLRTRSTSIVEDELHKPSTSKTPAKIKSVVEEIEDKRERMKNSLKKDLKNTPKVTNPIKDKMSKITKKTPSRKKARTPVKKLTPKRVEQLSKVCEVENEITDDDFALHLSTDEETINKSTIETDKNSEEPNRKVELTQKALISPQKNMDKETPDIEAEKLVQGLKERGIHLVHKKSPKKSTEITEDELKEHNTDKEKSKVILKNADIISDNGTDQKKNEVEILNSSLELSSNDLDVTFDIQHFENENVKTEYNYGKKKSKKMVYDSKCLEKEMKASVYIESLDMEMDRIIKCTPFEMIFNFTPKTETKRRKSTSSGKTIKLNVDSLVQKKHKDKKVDSDKKVKVDKQKKKTKQSFTATERVKEESDKSWIINLLQLNTQ
ncbi:hypothetical protein HHI36_017652 [Cryptolaemus montrouzieri]|uniref:Uncharacterized protein n=1 Tax=Cryptolaemus montrouzieri TaxID=559131 RepID=A0ABD2NP03_9CUCU